MIAQITRSGSGSTFSPLQEIVAKIQAEARKESRERLPGTPLPKDVVQLPLCVYTG